MYDLLGLPRCHRLRDAHAPEINQDRNAGFMVPVLKGFGCIVAVLVGRRIS